jgi:hypothetical protein
MVSEGEPGLQPGYVEVLGKHVPSMFRHNLWWQR